MFFLSTEFSRQSFSGFRTHVVATTLCTTGGVCTLTCCTHLFLRPARSLRTLHIFMPVTYTHGSSVCEKGVVCICVVSFHLAFSLLMFHPSLLFPHAYLDITFLSTRSCRTCPKSAGHAHLRTRTRSLAIWPSPPSTHVVCVFAIDQCFHLSFHGPCQILRPWEVFIHCHHFEVFVILCEPR